MLSISALENAIGALANKCVFQIPVRVLDYKALLSDDVWTMFRKSMPANTQFSEESNVLRMRSLMPFFVSLTPKSMLANLDQDNMAQSIHPTNVVPRQS